MEWIYGISAIASAIAAVLAWAAKLRWGKEYSAAKDEIIKAKDAQLESIKNEIESLREMTPMKIREYFLSVRKQLEEYIEALKVQLNKAQDEIERKTEEMTILRTEKDVQSSKIAKLEFERDNIEKKSRQLRCQVEELKAKYENVTNINIPFFTLSLIEKIKSTSAELTNQFSNYVISDHIYNLNKSLIDSQFVIDASYLFSNQDIDDSNEEGPTPSPTKK